MQALLQQAENVNRFAGIGRCRALQAGKCQQVIDQNLHALRLFRHEVQVAPGLVGIQRDALQRFNETRQHGQRGSDFMGDVGNEIAPHTIGLLLQGDIVREQQPLAIAECEKLDRQPHRVVQGVVASVNRDALFATGSQPVVDELRIAHEMNDVLLQVSRIAESEVFSCDQIEPLHSAQVVEQHDANGQRLNGVQKGREPFLRLRDLLCMPMLKGEGGIREVVPEFSGSWRGAQIGFLQPAQHAQPQDVVKDDPYAQHQQGHRQHPERSIGMTAPVQHQSQSQSDGLGNQQPGDFPIHGDDGMRGMGTWSSCTNARFIAFCMQAGIVAAGRTSALDSGNAIARAADGFDHVRRIVHRFAQAFDVHVDRAFFNGYVVAPDAIQQLGAAVHAFCMLHQIVQQLEFGRAQMDGPIGVLHAVRCGVEREIAKRDGGVGCFGRLAAQNCAHARQKFLG